jgi:hypothetical protein
VLSIQPVSLLLVELPHENTLKQVRKRFWQKFYDVAVPNKKTESKYI